MTDDVDYFYEIHNALTERLGGLPLPQSLTSHWVLFTGDPERVWVAADQPTGTGGRVVCVSKRWITVYTYTLRNAGADSNIDADVLVVARPVSGIARVDGGSAGNTISVACYFRDGSDPLLVPLARGDSVDKLFRLLELLNSDEE